VFALEEEVPSRRSGVFLSPPRDVVSSGCADALKRETEPRALILKRPSTDATLVPIGTCSRSSAQIPTPRTGLVLGDGGAPRSRRPTCRGRSRRKALSGRLRRAVDAGAQVDIFARA
jgi:hypothetical protein